MVGCYFVEVTHRNVDILKLNLIMGELSVTEYCTVCLFKVQSPSSASAATSHCFIWRHLVEGLINPTLYLESVSTIL